MSTPPPPRRAVAGPAHFVLGVAAGLVAALAVERLSRFFLDEDLELVRDVRDLAVEQYVHEVDTGALAIEAANGMLGSLDEHSYLYAPEEIAGLERETTGEFLGIGVVFREGDPGRVLFAYPDSPAARAGLRPGDRIVSAGGQPIPGTGLARLHEILQDGEVELELRGPEGEPRTVRVEPESVLDPTVRHARLLAADRGIGYVAIRSFSHRTAEELDAALADLTERGMRALVLDLRANPGGILDAAVSIANLFVASGTLVATRTRAETHATEADPDAARFAGLPLVVLVDAYSASASEVLAAALQDHAAAVLVGEPTYGKGTVQTLKHVGREGAVVKLTTAHYCSPSLRRIEHTDDGNERNGIAPDVRVPLTREQRQAAHAFLAGYSPPASALDELRAWEAREHVALVPAPPDDRQLSTAVALLSGEPLDLHGPALE